MADPCALLDSTPLYIDGRWVAPESGLGREGGGLRGLHRYMEPKAIGIPT